MSYVNKIYVYMILYFSNNLHNFNLNLKQTQNTSINIFSKLFMRLKILIILNINRSIFINLIQVFVYFYIWICCIDLINLYTFACWTEFFFLPTDLLWISMRIGSFLFIYYIIVDLIEIKTFKISQNYLNNIIGLNIICKPFYFSSKIFFKLKYNFIYLYTTPYFIKWTPIFKRHSYFGLWRNYRNNFFY